MKKLLAVFLSLVTALCFVGCGNNTQQDDPETLNIVVTRQGYGIQWAKDIVSAYQKKYPDKKVSLDTSYIGKISTNGIESMIDEKIVGTDIFMIQYDDIWKKLNAGEIEVNGKTYAHWFASLTDIYDEVLPGDTGANNTIRKKVYPDMLDIMQYSDGNYYYLPWVNGALGIVMNGDVWNTLKAKYSDLELPRTTNELFAFCDRIKGDVAPFTYSAKEEYYSSFWRVWFAQYEGSERYAVYNQGKGFDPNDEEKTSPRYVYGYNGQLESLKVFEKLLDKKNGYQKTSSDKDTFAEMQSGFVNDFALFCVNGAWLDIETSNYEKNLQFVPTPVISSITDNLDTVKDDATLSEIIKMIDEGKSYDEIKVAHTTVSEFDYNRIADARSIKYSMSGSTFGTLVPSYSTKIDAAKHFLKFMYSDEGLMCYYNALKGATMPVSLSTGDYPAVNESYPFRKSVLKVCAEREFVVTTVTKADIFTRGGINENFNNGGLGLPMQYLRSGEYNAEYIFNKQEEYLKSNWNSIKNKMGL